MSIETETSGGSSGCHRDIFHAAGCISHVGKFGSLTFHSSLCVRVRVRIYVMLVVLILLYQAVHMMALIIISTSFFPSLPPPWLRCYGHQYNPKVSSTKGAEGVEQGKLYSPAHAITINSSNDGVFLLAVMMAKAKAQEKLFQAAPEVSVNRARFILHTVGTYPDPATPGSSFGDDINSIKPHPSWSPPASPRFPGQDSMDRKRKKKKKTEKISKEN